MRRVLIFAMALALLTMCVGFAEEEGWTAPDQFPVEIDLPIDETLAPDDEGSEADPFAANTLALEPLSATIDYSQSVTLTATASSGGESVTWSTSDANVAALSATNGESINVTALNEGTAAITCSLGDLAQTCVVTVNAPTTLQITGVDYPSSFQMGHGGWRLRNGTVASTVDLLELTTVITNENGIIVGNSYTHTFEGGINHFDLKGIDNYIPFSKISDEGWFTWTLSATDVDGRAVSMSLPIVATGSGETVISSHSGVYAPAVVVPAIDLSSSDGTSGRNRILNSAFEHNQLYWADWGEPTTREFVQQDGKTWCHIVSTENVHWQGVQQNPYNMHGITATGYDQYTFSARVKGAAENQKFTMGIHWRDGSGTIAQEWNTWTIGTEEQTVSYTLTAAPGSEFFNLMVGVDDVDSATVHDIYFTDVKLEIGDTATAWSLAPEDVNSVADGCNRVLNSAFERSQENWSVWGAPMIREFVEQDGKTWCHIVSTENAHWQGVQQNAYETQGITVRGYERYVFSARVKGAAENAKFTMGIHWRNAKETISQTWNTWTIGTEEQIVSFVVTAAPGSRGFNLMVGVDDVDSAITHDIYFTNIKLELGDKPTDWSPAPEDAT